MSTTNDDRIAKIRRMCEGQYRHNQKAWQDGDVITLLSEVDRLTHELATATEERDYLKLWRGRDPSIDISELQFDPEDRARFLSYVVSQAKGVKWYADAPDYINVRYFDLMHVLRELAAHTWTPATPETMPPASAEFWQVRFHTDGAAWSDTLHSRGNQWMDHHGNMYPIDDTEFAAMPMERDAPAQDGGGDAEVTA